jgi:hypothetical protein
MPEYLLRLEAVNFAATCYDTNDLSTIRGGSMMLSNAHSLINKDELPACLRTDPVSSGASHAIWQFEATDDEAAEQVKLGTLQAFATDKHKQLLKHATFVCAVTPKSAKSDNPDDIQRLRLSNRWSQFQKPTVTAPSLPKDNARDRRKPYCELDRIRPSTTMISKGVNAKPLSVSESTRDKWDYGRTQKQRFYNDLASQPVVVVNELQELANHPEPHHRLTGKMCVIYIDGNKQSEMAAQYGLSELASFRTYVRNQHIQFLKKLLEEILKSKPLDGADNPSNEWFYWDATESDQTRRSQIRIETLLWGGDDIVLVVPAWQGMLVIKKFFEQASRWNFQNQKFTHSVGMVFCNVKAPIHNMRRFADQLVIQCKKHSSGLADADNYLDLVGYEVLESFDILDADLDRSWAARICQPPPLGEQSDSEKDSRLAKELLATPDQLQQLVAMIQAVKIEVSDPRSTISRRQIEMRARQMQSRLDTDSNFDSEIKDYFKGIPSFTQLSALSVRARLFHLVALWDYVE